MLVYSFAYSNLEDDFKYRRKFTKPLENISGDFPGNVFTIQEFLKVLIFTKSGHTQKRRRVKKNSEQDCLLQSVKLFRLS